LGWLIAFALHFKKGPSIGRCSTVTAKPGPDILRRPEVAVVLVFRLAHYLESPRKRERVAVVFPA
jgi:hypothetical protein